MAKEKVAVITGASHGIGASLVSAYSEAEYNVVANALSIGASTNGPRGIRVNAVPLGIIKTQSTSYAGLAQSAGHW